LDEDIGATFLLDCPSMLTTSVTLLQRLKNPGDQAAWRRFVELYTPLLLFWTRRTGLNETDAADVTQDVLIVLLNELPEFQYDPARTFRGWLRTVTLNKIRARFRRRALPSGNGDIGLSGVSAPDDLGELWEEEYRHHVVASALTLMKDEFEPTTWQACWEHTVSGRSAAEVGRELGLSEGAVYVAKCRVLRRLRQELANLLD